MCIGLYKVATSSPNKHPSSAGACPNERRSVSLYLSLCQGTRKKSISCCYIVPHPHTPSLLYAQDVSIFSTYSHHSSLQSSPNSTEKVTPFFPKSTKSFTPSVAPHLLTHKDKWYGSFKNVCLCACKKGKWKETIHDDLLMTRQKKITKKFCFPERKYSR